jgi:hypothetical protein
MVRRKAADETVQLNFRVTPQLFRELETHASERRVTVSEEARSRLEASLKGFGSYLADFEDQMRSAIEASLRSSRNPEPGLRLNAAIGALLRGTYTNLEELLLPHPHILANPQVRALMRGTRQERKGR